MFADEPIPYPKELTPDFLRPRVRRDLMEILANTPFDALLPMTQEWMIERYGEPIKSQFAVGDTRPIAICIEK